MKLPRNTQKPKAKPPADTETALARLVGWADQMENLVELLFKCVSRLYQQEGMSAPDVDLDRLMRARSFMGRLGAWQAEVNRELKETLAQCNETRTRFKAMAAEFQEVKADLLSVKAQLQELANTPQPQQAPSASPPPLAIVPFDWLKTDVVFRSVQGEPPATITVSETEPEPAKPSETQRESARRQKRWVRVAELMERLNLTRASVQHHIRRGNVVSRRLGDGRTCPQEVELASVRVAIEEGHFRDITEAPWPPEDEWEDADDES